MGPRKRLAVPLCLCLLGIVLVGGGFVWTVLSRPVKTPILTLTATYGPEWDLNAWVAEDLEAIGTLGNHTCSVQALPGIDQISGGFWDATDDMLRNSLASCPEHSPLVVYVNLHGAVNDDGAVCWIPPSAQVNDASTWFPIEEFLDHVSQSQASEMHHPIVLLLECGRLQSHWAAGIADNEFDAKLGELAGKHQRKYPGSKLAILNSTSAGERSLYSRLGDGDVFTRYIAEGLSGAADGFSGDDSNDTARVDGKVDTDELHQFVLKRVGNWAKQHRGRTQTPTLHRPHSTGATVLTRVCRVHRPESPKTPAPTKSEIDRLRSTAKVVIDLKADDAISVDAHAWSQIQRTLHAIEQSVYGGVAARSSTDRWYSRLNRQVQNLKQEMRERASESSQFADLQMDRQASVIWSALAKQATHTAAEDLVREVQTEATMPVPMLKALLDRPELSFWKDANVIERMAEAQSHWLNTTLQLPDAIFPAAEQVCQKVHESRRRLADAILVDEADAQVSNPQAADNSLVSIKLQQFELEVTKRTKMLEDLSRAWRLRERAFLELPYLYQSVEQREQPVEEALAHAGARTDSEHQRQAGGIYDVMRLDALLIDFVVQKHPWDDAAHDRVTIVSEHVAEYLDELSQLHGNASLVSEGKKNTVEIPRMMSMDADQMMRTEEQLRRIDETQSRQTSKRLHVSTHSTEKEAVHQDIEDDIHSAKPDYLAVLLGLNPESSSAATIRRQLRALTDTVLNDANAEQTMGQEWRRAVSLVVDEKLSLVIDAAREQSRQQRLASRAAEVLDDFWYEPANNGTPYFAATSQSLLDNASSSTPTTAPWRTRRRDLNQLLESRKLAANNGLAVQANWQPSYSRSDLAEVSVAITKVQGEGQLPDGMGLVSIRNATDSATTSKRSVGLHAKDSETTSLALSVNSLAGVSLPGVSLPGVSQSNSDAVAEIHFRGNVFRSSVVASNAAFGTTSQATPTSHQAKVTVSDAMDSRRLISFVLDCSASMNDPTGTEAIRSQPDTATATDTATPTKFDAARSALYEMLRRLRPTGTEVGLVMYGHRMAIGAKDQNLLLQKRYHKRFPFPATVQPFEDVEVALSAGRFDEVELDLARQHFEAAVPWGQTPLYLAISRAIDDASRATNTTSKDVIVISDGRNYQFNPTPDAIVSAQELITKAKLRRVRVHVIGFGIPRGDAVAAADEFALIAEGTGGTSVTDVKEATGLLRRLQELAADQTFTVELADGSSVKAAFGQTLELDHIETANAAVNITVGENRSSIPVSPGDHLMLVANRMQDSLSAKPYLDGAPQFVNLVSPNGMTLPTRLGVQVPHLSSDGDCQFRVSLQRADQQVVQRPKMFWVEVQPEYQSSTSLATSADKAGAYRIGNCRWLPNMSCPVAEFSCLDWPTEATGYQLQAWTADEEIAGENPGHVVKFDPSAGDVAKSLFPGLPGIEYQVRITAEGFEIGIDYQQGEVANPDAMLLVSLEGAGATDSEHWYDEHGKKSFHRFKIAEHAHEASEPIESVQLNSAATFPSDAGSNALSLTVRTIAELKAVCTRSTHPIAGSMHPVIASVPATARR